MIFLSSSLTYRYLSILFLINLSLFINLSSSFRNNCIVNLIILSRNWTDNEIEILRKFDDFVLGKRTRKFLGGMVGRWGGPDISNRRRSRWRDFRDVDNCVCFIRDFHVIARGPNFIYTRRKVRARYYLDLLQFGIGIPVADAARLPTSFPMWITTRSRLVEPKYLNERSNKIQNAGSTTVAGNNYYCSRNLFIPKGRIFPFHDKWNFSSNLIVINYETL